jgi:hypothetical protein
MIKSSSYEFWRGVGLDGGPVVAIAIGLINKSTNRKTGDGRVELSMVQTYILRADMSPVAASNLGLDRSVCGDCDLRWFTWRIRKRETGETRAKCYVNVGWLTGIWRSWNAGNMPRISPAELGDIIEASGMPVRQGAYGDPAVVPADVWAQLDRRRGTSYRYYRVDLEEVGAQDGEITCPNQTQGTTCADCGLCAGLRNGAGTKNIVIHPMGKFK